MLFFPWISVKAVILLTKADLVDDYGEYLCQVARVAAGVDTYVFSAHTLYGLEHLNAYGRATGS